MIWGRGKKVRKRPGPLGCGGGRCLVVRSKCVAFTSAEFCPITSSRLTKVSEFYRVFLSRPILFRVFPLRRAGRCQCVYIKVLTMDFKIYTKSLF